MTIRGIKKEIKLNVTYNGSTKGFGGIDVAGFEITGKINRFDFGLQWNALTEVGGIVVADEVKIDISAELQKA
jgi:polyisoprenoid-binding protein YceI